MCYIQCAIAFVAIFVVKRNNVQQMRDKEQDKNEKSINQSQRKDIRKQIRASNSNYSGDTFIYHSGQSYSPAQALTFCDAFRSKQLHIIWFLQLLQSASAILFTFEFIQTSAQDIEQNEELSRLYFMAILAAGTVSPLFGILNDWLGARVNNVISRSLPALAAASTLWIEPFDT